jgi:two-component system sensor histidine kinase TctE
MPQKDRSAEPRSLFGEVLDWMLAPLLWLWPMSLAITWLVAQGIANLPYDRQLGERTEALAREAAAALGQPSSERGVRIDIERAARVLLAVDEEDEFFFQVLGRQGELLAGESRLAVPDADDAPARRLRFRDDLIGEQPVRVAYLWLAGVPGPDSDALVQVAETLGKRSTLATEIVKGVILPQFVILPVAVLLVWFALKRGFTPLDNIQARIRRRDSTDLSPIDERGVPEEVVPLVRAINELLQRLDRSMGAQRHFLADAAHQLKTPLAGLRTQAELTVREIDSGRADPAVMKQSLRQIAISSQRAAHMVNQLLSMARVEHGGAIERRVPVDLSAVTRDAVRDLVPRSLERRLDLGYEGPGERDGGEAAVRPQVLGEPVLLGELVRNLIDNALQYTPTGGSVTARVWAETDSRAVVLQVEDSGPGVAPAERELIFKPFYRSLGTQVDGTGLGLAIVAEVAQRYGAQVTVDDARPRGAAAADGSAAPMPGALFTVRFPAAAPLLAGPTAGSG